MLAAVTVPHPHPEASCSVGSFTCLQGHCLLTLLLQKPKREAMNGESEATKHPGKPPQ